MTNKVNKLTPPKEVYSSDPQNEGYIKGFLLDPINNRAETVLFRPVLEEYYRLLRCDLIDYCMRSVAGQNFSIVCDDEGLYKKPTIPSAYNKSGNVVLVGPLMFIGPNNDEGRDTGLTNDQCKLLLDNVATVLFKSKDDIRKGKVMTNMDWPTT